MCPVIDTVICFSKQYLYGRNNLNSHKIQHNPNRSNTRQQGNNADKNEGANPPTGIKKQIGTHKTKNRTACANARDTRVRLHKDEEHMSPRPGEEIEGQETPRATGIFHPSS